MTTSLKLLGCLGLLAACQGLPASRVEPTSGHPPSQPLKLESARFYEAGVAYFERAGSSPGGVSVALLVPEPQLEEALRSMVILSGATAEAPALAFESLTAKELLRARARLDEKSLGYRKLLEDLVGAEVEAVRPSGRVVGRLVEVSEAAAIRKQEHGGDAMEVLARTFDDYFLTVANADGSLARLRTSELSRFRPTDPARQARLDAALATLPGAGEPPPRALCAPTAPGPLRFGYVATTPIWQTSYRLFLNAAEGARLTGSALVHNDTDEPWSNVRVSFASTRPDAVASELATPGYVAGDASKTAPFRKAYETSNDHRAIETGSFEYAARAPLSVGPRSGALVAFIDARVEAPAAVWFAGPTALGKRAVRLKNATAQAFPEGALSVYSTAGYEGEAMLPRVAPGAVTLVTFADDLDVGLKLEKQDATTTVDAAGFDGESLVKRAHYRSTLAYRITNRKPGAVTVFLPVHARAGSKVSGADRVDTDPQLTAVFELKPGQTETRTLTLESEGVEYVNYADLQPQNLDDLLRSQVLPRALLPALRAARAVAERMAQNQTAIQTSEERLPELDGELESAHTDVTDNADASEPVTRALIGRWNAAQAARDREAAHGAELQVTADRLAAELQRVLSRLPKLNTEL